MELEDLGMYDLYTCQIVCHHDRAELAYIRRNEIQQGANDMSVAAEGYDHVRHTHFTNHDNLPRMA